MEELSIFGLIARALGIAATPVKLEPELFESIIVPPQRRWGCFLASIAAHTLFVYVVLPLAYLLPEAASSQDQKYLLALRPLQLQIPDHLYFSSPLRMELPPPVSQQQRRLKARQLAVQPQGEEQARGSSTRQKSPPRRFRLPDVARRPFSPQTLIQPDLPPELALHARVRLPQLLLSPPALPRPRPRRFVQPGSSPPPDIAPKKPDAPPPVITPAAIPQEILIPTMLAGPEHAALRLPRPTMPVKIFAPPSASASRLSGNGSSISPAVGEPVHVVAYSTNPALLTDKVLVPPGNQIGRLPGPPPSTDPAAPVGIPVGGDSLSAGTGEQGRSSADGSGKGAGGSGNRGRGGGAAGVANRGHGGGPGEIGGTGPGVGVGVSGSGGFGGGPDGWDGGGTMAAALSAPPTTVLNYTTPIRIEHPANGVFDVIVSQTSVDEALPESAGALSGKPVYTVYVQVGAPRAWLLQYCVPKGVEEEPRVVGGAVYIGKPSPLKAPFPLVTVLPPVALEPRTTYIMVHGFVDKTGQFQDLNVLRAPNDRVKGLLLPQLVQWRFRPATRNGVPVLVEILLVIPPTES